ncbi:D-amino acid dehydrogenase [Herbaspirillum sp. RV1423]|uniref:D-amino acid dehydrogenase n=1 Tax=Herbaspirillum sp. RV1423 TaxID=1443993 RepID=UPI00055441F1|nr:D-amino acid dehydrogenase [Herbaspirillum sp. RV1423]
MHICVLGAGIIGVTSAYRLLQDGHDVTLLDARPEAGAGTSLGNGAQLSYSYVAPLADPSVWTHWPHYLFSADSPLTLKPQPDPAQWRWLFKFLGACNAGRVQRTTIELLQLAFYSRDELRQVQQVAPFDFSHRTAGKLVMYTDPAGLASARRQVAFQAQHGCEQEVIDADRCIEIEPALANASRHWAGGVYTPSEEAGDCAQFCLGLVKIMQAQRGFRFLPSTTITQVKMNDGAIRSVQAGADRISIDADAFVLALGAESATFARQAGFTLPLYPLKGYSITVPLDDAGAQAAAPQVSITDIAKKIVYARLGNRLRVAGRVELVGMDKRIPQRAIDELTDGANELFPGSIGAGNAARLSPWAGFRPATPSGVPIIGASPVRNLYLNIGHGALGWTLACGSAAMLAAQIGDRKTAIDDAPFRYAR